VPISITSIPQIYRNLNRTVEILSVLSKYGVANWIARLDLEFAKELLKNRSGEVLARHTTATRIRLALSELGPTFIKLGQVLSTRADLIGLELAQELQKLQDSLPADAPREVRNTIETELKRSLEEIYAEFEEAPLASASIGQVHGALLHTGERVVVKVRHAGIEEKIRVDLDILAGLAQLAERVPEFKNYRPQALVAEFQRTLMRELDFAREQRYMQQFAQDFARDPYVRVPRCFPELTTHQVLTMERLDGIKLSETERLTSTGVDLEQISRRGAQLFLEMIFSLGYYHADPHPGNIVVLPGNVIGLLDYGMVGRIDEQLREDIEEMLVAIANRDAVHLTYVITRLGAVPADLDQAGLSLDVSEFVAHYSNQPLAELNVSSLLNEMMEMIRRYQIMLPARIAMLIKTVVMLEGTSRLASPNFSLTEVLAPYQRKMILRRLSPARQIKKLRRLYSELERLAAVLPRGLIDILQQVQTGRFDVHLDHRGLEPSVNRLALALLTSALFLGSSLMLSQKVPPLVNIYLIAKDLSVLGMLGCAVSVALGLRLLWAINKSGRLDQRK
jgi:ubiquinone biosynthesis protein